MPAVAIEILIVLLLVTVNGFFALAELAIISSRKQRLQQLSDRGMHGAQAALQLAEAPGSFLASVQVGITLVGIVAGAFGGATLSREVAQWLATIPRIAPYAGALSFLIIVGAITYLSVVVGELVPKRISLANPEAWAVRVARPMRVVAWVAAPVVGFLTASSNAILWLLRVPSAGRPAVSDEEVKLLIEEGIVAGVFEPAEKEIVNRLFRLSDRRANVVMTARPDIVWLEIDATREEIIEVLLTHIYTAYPVAEDDLDNLLGVVFAQDLLPRLLAGEAIDLRALVQPPLILPEWAYALKSIEPLRRHASHLAIIINEYGGTEGLLTLSDLVSSLVGEIVTAAEEPDIVQRVGGSLSVDGFTPVDEVKEALGVSTFPEEEEGHYRTLAGFIMFYLGRVPTVGDTFDWGSFHFEIVDMDAHRIDRVIITRMPNNP